MSLVHGTQPHLVLTSNFPRSGNGQVARYLMERASVETLTWTSAIPNEDLFQAARTDFKSFGFREIVQVKVDDPTSAHHGGSSAAYLSGGDPIKFREALIASRFGGWLSDACAAGRVLLGASGGAMQFTPNVSIFRLMETELHAVLEERESYKGLGLVPFEVLPHFDRHPPDFIEKVRLYSERVNNVIWCLPDGAAVAVVNNGPAVTFGKAVRLSSGTFA